VRNKPITTDAIGNRCIFLLKQQQNAGNVTEMNYFNDFSPLCYCLFS